MSTNDRDDKTKDPKTGPGSTSDPNQANRTPMPKEETIRPNATSDSKRDSGTPSSGPGSTSDPNQANRT
ncbi:hypothetical protein [Palleronia sp.]|uniref:hypothetical protein n=1 Tax=Palleronia sp. TaxID=1940284 RepID=UPI0035C82273